jgi:hypothetical protein
LREELKKNYWIVDNGYNSFPTKIPGTQYKKALLVSIINFLNLCFLNAMLIC